MKECQGNRRHRTEERVGPPGDKGEQRTVEETDCSIYVCLLRGYTGTGNPFRQEGGQFIQVLWRPGYEGTKMDLDQESVEVVRA